MALGIPFIALVLTPADGEFVFNSAGSGVSWFEVAPQDASIYTEYTVEYPQAHEDFDKVITYKNLIISTPENAVIDLKVGTDIKITAIAGNIIIHYRP